MTDSEQVPRGKGEKHPGEGSEIVTETICLQRANADAAHRKSEARNPKLETNPENPKFKI